MIATRPHRPRRAPAIALLALAISTVVHASARETPGIAPQAALGSRAHHAIAARREDSRTQAALEAAHPVVFPGHPRLIVGGFRGVPTDALRAACTHPDMRGECDRIGGRHLLDDAMRFLLTGDEAAAASARAVLLGGLACSDGYEQTPAGGHALAYDWIWSTLSGDDRRSIESALTGCAANMATALRGEAPHLWHGFTSQASALALIALAVDDPSQRDRLLADAVELFRGRALEAYAVTGGAWPEGYSYLRTHFFSGDPPYQYLMDALRAWDSAVEWDTAEHASLFETIAAEEGDWLRGLAYHVLYGTLALGGGSSRPSLLRGGDMPTGQLYPTKQVRPYMDAIARVYGDPHLALWGRDLEASWPFVAGDGTYHPIHRYSLPYNLPLDVAAGPAAPLPRARIWGRDDLGYLITRSQWGPGETVVSYRAGKWFTGHQHMDQGHFDVWHRGPLLVDSGVYAAWGSEHREAWYARTVAHNTLLVTRPGEFFEEHPALARAVNDGGQRIHTHNRRGCAQCIQSVGEWRSHLGAGLHFEAGRIDAYEDGLRFTVVASDLTAAYNSTAYATPGNAAKVSLVQRDLVYVRPALLFVLDRVRTVPGSEAPRFALHFPDRPDLAPEPPVASGSRQDGVLAGPVGGLRFGVTNGAGGTLTGRTLEPDRAQVVLIGGPTHRYWVDGANRAGGAEGLDAPPAEPGQWRLEVAPAAPPAATEASDWLLAHALTVGDSGTPAIDAVQLSTSTDPARPARVLALWAPGSAPSEPASHTLVIASGAVPRATLGYVKLSVPEGPALLIVAGAMPGAIYPIRVSGRALPAVTASGQGVAQAIVPGGQLTIGSCPAVPEAGEEWRSLCSGHRLYLPVGVTHRPSPAAGRTPTEACALTNR